MEDSTTSNPLPAYDPDESLQLAAGDKSLAEDLFGLLIAELPGQMADVSSAYHAGNAERLYQLVHKINGSTQYTGVPALRRAANNLGLKIKDGGINNIKIELADLEHEIKRLLEVAKF
ncbi:MAG: hypothetical protein BMS9Abin26_0119 [Gammaproteobacteria bacterium]|nr:MAG: hypothetical protein BMS9Abin26_0119 [Gammaproteobacteria bacterium]